MPFRWDPQQYVKFAAQRAQPGADLIARIPEVMPELICDLGAGNGDVTQMLAQRWPNTRIFGIDASREMLRMARQEYPAVRWLEANIETWSPAEKADVLFSNAALQWVGKHEKLFSRLVACVRKGGAMAVQMPTMMRNDKAYFRAIVDAIESGPWRDTLRPLVSNNRTLELPQYYDLLAPLTRTLDLWETTYYHVLSGDNPIVEFGLGSGLRPYVDALPHDVQRNQFLAAFTRLVRESFSPRANGNTIFPYRRIFIVATI